MLGPSSGSTLTPPAASAVTNSLRQATSRWSLAKPFSAGESRTTSDQRLTTFLNKKSAHRSFFVNGLNCPSNQPRDRKHLDLRDLPGRFAQRDSVGHDHLGDRRVHKIFHRRP